MFEIKPMNGQYTYNQLLEVMTQLRSDQGCPWDKEQDHESLKNSVIEEAYELVEAINNKDLHNLKEELGDLLLQVVFHSQIGKDSGTFTMEEVVHGIVEKLIRRHPHVFGDPTLLNPSEVLEQWDEIKLKEKTISRVSEDIKLVPKALPALIKSYKVQKKVAKIGFDFPDFKSAFSKVEEEMEELMEAYESDNFSQIEEEFGDLLFSMVNISRFLGLNPENALTNALEKFINRFEGIETLAIARGKDIAEMSVEEMDDLWNTIKTC